MKKWYLLFVFAKLFGDLKDISAYDVDSHGAITERAIVVSTVDRILKEDLRLAKGIETELLGGEILKWARNGAILEDWPYSRVLNHFHNPLAPWPSAGLHVESMDGTRSIDGLSSVLWQQYPAQHADKTGGDWAWHDARRRYLAALVTADTTEREQAFAETFLTLGHLMHLVQDASVPAHTRNDPHLLWEGYESWVERIRSDPATSTTFFTILNGSPLMPASTIFTSTNSTEAPAPIARLIDADIFDGSNGTILTGDTIGMAEYTNGNFVSDNTIFTSDFLLPHPQSLGAGFFVPEGQGQRQYFSKVGAGEQVTHFVAEGVWHERLRLGQTAVGDYILTDRVFEDYARKLLPRAVGYSAALLDYFFRGKLDLEPAPNVSGQYIITNRGTETLEGEFSLYYDDAQGNRHPITLTPATTDGLASQETMTVSLTPPTAPAPKTPGEYMLVFRGEMGEEKPINGSVGGVVAKKIIITSPFLLDTQYCSARTLTVERALPIFFPSPCQGEG